MHKNTIIVYKKKENKKQIVRRISIIGIIINLLLFIIKFLVGNVSNSQALLADSLHSLEDMASSIISLVGIKISTKGKNQKHPYGYGKAEYIFSMIISILMLMGSITIIKSSLTNLTTLNKMSFNIIIVSICIINIILKSILYFYTNKKLKQTNNILIKASREDQKNDILITLSILISSILSVYGIYWIDYLLGIFISIWMAIMSIKIFIISYNILIDTNISIEKINDIKTKLLLYDEIESVNEIIGKPIGDKYVIILNLSMNKELKIYKSYDIQSNIKKMLLKYDYIHDVIINIKPY